MHPWQECRPAMVQIDEDELQRTGIAAVELDRMRLETGRINAAMSAAWDALGPEGHQAFHEFICLFEHDQRRFEVLEAFTADIRRRLQADRN